MRSVYVLSETPCLQRWCRCAVSPFARQAFAWCFTCCLLNLRIRQPMATYKKCTRRGELSKGHLGGALANSGRVLHVLPDRKCPLFHSCPCLSPATAPSEQWKPNARNIEVPVEITAYDYRNQWYLFWNSAALPWYFLFQLYNTTVMQQNSGKLSPTLIMAK